jgi:sugar-specific transcriptional regulator TrmB
MASLSGIDLFPLASSPVASPRMSILAYLASGPATSTQLAEAIGLHRQPVWRYLSALEDRGLVATRRRAWYITPPGLDELRRLRRELDVQIRNADEERTNLR